MIPYIVPVTHGMECVNVSGWMQTMERIDMAIAEREPLSHYLNLAYPYTVIKDDEAFFVEFPDLPGCMTQVEDAADIAPMAEEIRILWIETEYERGAIIPEPVTTASFSGKFVVRVPKALHKELVTTARREGSSLNAYITYLLAERNIAVQTVSRKESLDPLVDHANTQAINSHSDLVGPELTRRR